MMWCNIPQQRAGVCEALSLRSVSLPLILLFMWTSRKGSLIYFLFAEAHKAVSWGSGRGTDSFLPLPASHSPAVLRSKPAPYKISNSRFLTAIGLLVIMGNDKSNTVK